MVAARSHKPMSKRDRYPCTPTNSRGLDMNMCEIAILLVLAIAVISPVALILNNKSEKNKEINRFLKPFKR